MLVVLTGTYCNKVIIQIQRDDFIQKNLLVSDRSSVHHQEFFTVHKAMLCHTGYADSLLASMSA